MRTLAVIQCRLASTRLPAKAALDLHGQPLLARVIERCRYATGIDKLVVATSRSEEDTIVEAIARRCGVAVFRGATDDVRQRMLDCAHHYQAEVMLRLTADNPYLEPAFIEALLAVKKREPTCPYAVHDLARVVHGTASELVDVAVLTSRQNGLAVVGREHVTTGLAGLAGARILTPAPEVADARLSLSIDTIAQYQTIWQLMARFGAGPAALAEIVDAFRSGRVPAAAFPMRAA